VISVTLQFKDAAEAATFLASGGVPAAAPAKKRAPAKKPAPAAAKVAETAPAPTVTVDRDAVINEVRELVTEVVAGPKAAEHKAYYLSLVAKHGGKMKATEVPDATLPAFLVDLQTYAASLRDAPAPAEESLI
jgi:hypothetical protein